MAELIELKGSFKVKDTFPIDSREVVKAYIDISSISNPSVGLLIYVEETS